MYEGAICVLLLIVAAIHLLPLSGAAGSRRLSALYGLAIDDPNLEILMRHRAVLFGLLGLFFIYAAFNPSVQPAAFAAAFVSIASFFWLALSVGNYNASIRKVVIADIVAAVSLCAAIALYLVKTAS